MKFIKYQGPTEGSGSSRLAEICQELEAIEADKAPARAALILAGLGFSPDGQNRPTRKISEEFMGIWILQQNSKGITLIIESYQRD